MNDRKRPFEVWELGEYSARIVDADGLTIHDFEFNDQCPDFSDESVSERAIWFEEIKWTCAAMNAYALPK